MEKIISEFKAMITAKAIISAVSVGMIVPLSKLIYWVFDTAYLGGFGINPDVYSRPIFASGFVGAWLVAESMRPIIIGWSLFALVLFVVLTGANIGSSSRSIKTKFPQEQSVDKQSLFKRIGLSAAHVFEASSKSIEWPSIIWVAGIAIVLFLGLSVAWASKKGANLATAQLNGYIEDGRCVDKFNSSNIGCFRIQNVDGENHFVIASSNKYILFLSRISAAENDDLPAAGGNLVNLNILEKEAGKQYSIFREFRHTK